MQVDFEQIKSLIEAAQNANASWRVDYAGRGMFGKNCFGITGDMGTVWDFAIELALIDDTLASELGAPTTDSMGRGMIAYWPKVKVDAELAKKVTEEFGECED